MMRRIGLWLALGLALSADPSRAQSTRPIDFSALLKPPAVTVTHGDCLRQRVGFFRHTWRNRWVYFTVITAKGDTLGRNLLQSEFERVAARQAPEDLENLTMILHCARIDQDDRGHYRRSPSRENKVDLERLIEYDTQWQVKGWQPPPLPR